jgi:NADPH:quinone reductase-like Zn-dependent oxidoreductase
MQGGATGEVNLGALMGKRASIASTGLRSRPPAEKAEIIVGVREQVWPHIESGAIKPVIHTRMPMAEAAAAHALVASNEHLGKVLLVN